MALIKKIQLSGKFGVGKFALVDEEDFDRVSTRQWWYHNAGYAVCKTLGIKPRRVLYMHRVILNAREDQEVDHANGNPLDNRRSNLRLCTHSENAFNKRMMKNNTSGFKGVGWDKANQKWTAIISMNGKSIHLGRFPDAEDAALSYNEAATKYFGKFARINSNT